MKKAKIRRIRIAGGCKIETAIEKAIHFAKVDTNKALEKGKRPRQRMVCFKFNGVTVIVCHDSDPDAVYRDYLKAFYGYIDTTIGPNYRDNHYFSHSQQQQE